MEQTKICTKCHEEKPLSEFYKAKTGKFGLRGDCRVCCAIYLKKYYSNNPNKKKEKKDDQKKHYSNNRCEILEHQKCYRAENLNKVRAIARKASTKHRKLFPEQVKDQGRKYYWDNPEKFRIRKRIAGRLSYAKNPEKFRARSRINHHKNQGIRNFFQFLHIQTVLNRI